MFQENIQSLRQPKALYLLFAVQMWECFSFYGMRALLVLYMVNKLGLSDMHAYGIYAIYCSLVEFGGILGGRLADKVLGLRQSIVLGGWLIAAGHICMALEGKNNLFFIGLALIVVGSALFSTNISALLGMFYEEEDPRREQGFTLFYVGINVGAFLSSILCGVIGETYGWHYGFGLAAIGMLIGLTMFYCLGKILENKGQAPKEVRKREYTLSCVLLCLAIPFVSFMIAKEEIFMQVLPWLGLICIGYIGKQMFYSKEFSLEKLASLGLYLAALAFFFAAEEQAGSSLLVFSERYASGTILGIEIPNTVLLSLNPLTIILGGAFVARLFRNAKNNIIHWRVTLGLIMAAAVFAMLMIVCSLNGDESPVPLVYIFGGIVVMSLAELLLAPAIYAFCSEIAPKEWLGATMGLIPIGYSLASLISGFFSKSMAIEGESSTAAIASYSSGFGVVSIFLSIMALIIVFGEPLMKKILKPHLF